MGKGFGSHWSTLSGSDWICLVTHGPLEVDLHELCERGDVECVWILLSQDRLPKLLSFPKLVDSCRFSTHRWSMMVQNDQDNIDILQLLPR